MSRVKVLLVDDQAIIRDGLVALLQNDTGMEVVGMAANGEEAVAAVARSLPHVVVMDISMPVMDGIEATRLIRKDFPQCHVLVLSMYHLQDVIDNAFDAGASGYILKNTTQAQFREAIRVVAKGQRFIGPEVEKELDAMALASGGGTTPQANLLTKREKEIIILIAQGRTNQEIAEDLKLSLVTVQTHRKNIMHKLKVRNVAELVKYALERGWNH